MPSDFSLSALKTDIGEVMFSVAEDSFSAVTLEEASSVSGAATMRLADIKRLVSIADAKVGNYILIFQNRSDIN